MARIRDILRGWGPADPQNILKRDSRFSQWVVIELGGSLIQGDVGEVLHLYNLPILVIKAEYGYSDIVQIYNV